MTSVTASQQRPGGARSQVSLGDLPEGLLHSIAALLKAKDRLSLSHTAKSFHHAAICWFAVVKVAVEPTLHADGVAAWLRTHTAPGGSPAEAHLAAWGAGSAALGSVVDALRGLPVTNLQLSWNFGKPTLELSVLRGLGQLTSLSVHDAKLDGSLGPLSKLTALQSLELSFCELCRMPRSLAALPGLTSLTLDDNSELSIASLGRVLPRLTQLQDLSMSSCDLWSVPEGLTALTALTSLNLSRNSIAEVGELAALTNLRHLDIGDNPCSVPEELLVLNALNQLYLHKELVESLASVPPVISKLTTLEVLDLSYNRNMHEGWEHLRPLARLRELRLSCSRMREVPHAFSVLQALEVLEMDYCSPRKGWRNLLMLPRLRRLSVGSNPPPDVWEAVEEVNIKGSELIV